jgi:hypothetical protein
LDGAEKRVAALGPWNALRQARLARPRADAARALAQPRLWTHVKRILMKLGLRDRVQIVIFAYETEVNRPAAAPDPSPP